MAVIIAVVVIGLLVSGGGSSKAAVSAINWTSPTGSKVYGALGPEGVPLERGAPLGPANRGLTGAAIDSVQCNTGEQVAYHHHVHLAIFLDGQPRSVPYGIGMVAPLTVQRTPAGDFAGSQTCFYWIHVHASDGIIHLESPNSQAFTLGQFFDIWHQTLSIGRLGSTSGLVHATVDGRVWNGDPSQIPLDQHAQIILRVGSPDVTPPPISWKGTGL